MYSILFNSEDLEEIEQCNYKLTETRLSNWEYSLSEIVNIYIQLSKISNEEVKINIVLDKENKIIFDDISIGFLIQFMENNLLFLNKYVSGKWVFIFNEV